MGLKNQHNQISSIRTSRVTHLILDLFSDVLKTGPWWRHCCVFTVTLYWLKAFNQKGQQNTAFGLLLSYSLRNNPIPSLVHFIKQDYSVESVYFLILMLTTITCVTVFRLVSPPIKVLRKTPVVQKVSSVLGETLRFQSPQLKESLQF